MLHHGVARSPPHTRGRTRAAAVRPRAATRRARASRAQPRTRPACTRHARRMAPVSKMMVVVAAAERAGERECERAAGEGSRAGRAHR